MYRMCSYLHRAHCSQVWSMVFLCSCCIEIFLEITELNRKVPRQARRQIGWRSGARDVIPKEIKYQIKDPEWSNRLRGKYRLGKIGVSWDAWRKVGSQWHRCESNVRVRLKAKKRKLTFSILSVLLKLDRALRIYNLCDWRSRSLSELETVEHETGGDLLGFAHFHYRDF